MSLGAQGGRYLIVGVLNTLVGLGAFALALWLLEGRVPLAHQLAMVANWATGTVHSYLWNRYWTFQAGTGAVSRQLPRFVLINLGLMALNAFMLEGLVRLLPALVAQVLCIGVTTLLGFVGHRRFSFADRPQES